MSEAVYITRTAAFLPNPPVENDDMERVLGQVGERPSRARRTILRSNGIRTRHYAIDPHTLQPTHTNAALTAEAVRGLADAGFELNALECLACGTSIADQVMPNHAVMVQGELGLHTLEVVATAGVCLSGLTALRYAYLSVLSGQRSNAVATGSELASQVMQAGNFSGETAAQLEQLERQPELAFEKDFLRWMLSDGAGAVLLQPEPAADRISLRIDWIELFSYSGEMEACMYAGAVKGEDGKLTGWGRMSARERESCSVMAIKQDVKLLNESVIRYTVEEPLRTLRQRGRVRGEDFDWFLPHYSSLYFRDRVYAGMEKAEVVVPQERWFTNLSERGNTGSASIYIMIDELLRSGRVQRGQRLLCYIPESGRFSTGFMALTAV